MSKVILDVSMSLDGFITGPSVGVERPLGTTFTFVTDGIESALEQAKAAADDKNVGLMGANTAQQYLKARLIDEMQIHIVPVLLGGGTRLFDPVGTEQIELERTREIESPGVTHLRFRVVR